MVSKNKQTKPLLDLDILNYMKNFNILKTRSQMK